MHAQSLGVLRQYGAALSVALSVFAVGNWLSWPSSAVKHLLAGDAKLSLDASHVSWVVALLDVGNVLSPVPSSHVANSLGRKRPILLLSVLLLITWLLAVFGSNQYYLYAARLIAGICKGLAFTVVPIYLGEIADTNVRGRVGTIFTGMINYGILFELSVGPLVSYNTLNIISTPFPILSFLLFFNMPESPYFLLMKGKSEEALKALSWFRNLPENSPVLQEELKKISLNVDEDMKQSGSFKELARSKSNRKSMLITVTLALLQRLSGVSCIIAYTTVTLPSTGGYFSPEVYMIFFGVTMVVGQSVCSVLIDKSGRKPLLIVSSFGCGLCTTISAVFYWLNEFNDITSYNWVPYACVIFYGIMFSVGLGTIPSIIAVELFSSDVRSYAGSIAAICYAFGSFISTKLYLYVQLRFGTHFMFLFFTIMTFICIVFTCTVVFETKGKTFMEIQSILKKVSTDQTNKKVFNNERSQNDDFNASPALIVHTNKQ